MQELMDKGFIMACCLAAGLSHSAEPALAVPFIVAVLASAGNSYRELPWLRYGSVCVLFLSTFLQPAFILFAPLYLYDVFLTRQAWAALLLLPSMAFAFPTVGLSLAVLVLLFSCAAFLLKRKTVRHGQLLISHNRLRDSAAELAMKLESTNRELRLHQDEQVHTVRLAERNRIAREIHDNVGHLLSSAMLQLGALLSLPQAEGLREPLLTLKDTLSQGMNSIRQSVHGLHDESVDLQEELSSLVRSFTFCPVSLDYDVETNPDRRIKYAFLAVVKEALSNIARHSSATAATVTVREHPALYQLDIRDNGENAIYEPGKAGGIGIANMTDRVTGLNGRILISAEKGFHIFISIPKEVQS